MTLNHTHDSTARSWVASANQAGTDFPIQNLPFAVFKPKSAPAHDWRAGIAIGKEVLDLPALATTGLLQGLALQAAQAGAADALNPIMALGQPAWHALRHAVFALLKDDAATGVQAQVQTCLHPQADVVFNLPARVGDYTDFYTSIHHATNIGKLFRPDNPLLPNYTWVPIGYHGRSSSLQVSGSDVRRPNGQTMPPGATAPAFGPCKRLDWEVELGVLVGTGNTLGEPITIDRAEDHVFGICLLNDWSARDIQAWEYQPLGPFLSKNFGTTLSPWVVTLEALAPFRTAMERPDGKWDDLPYLSHDTNRQQGALDIQLSIGIATEGMRQAGQPAHMVSQTSYRHAYWTMAQMVTHHTVNGCNLQPGDLLGSGTLSGPQPAQAGALIELTQGGKLPVTLADGSQRTFLQDGDEVVMRGWCEAPGAARIGFGECRAIILPAIAI
ncbi:MAG TPA: fumarylacetoacetase [Burkholderiaceae bacterium]|nr:fumarylacetoacetase [Burkholderiaceae bacterium]